MSQERAGLSGAVQKVRRPSAVALLALGFFWVSLSGWARLYLAIRDWALLAELGVIGGPLYLALGGALWGLLALPAAWALWSAQRWAPITARLVAVILFLSFWADRLLIAWVGSPPPNGFFALVISLFGLVFTFGALALPATRAFLKK